VFLHGGPGDDARSVSSVSSGINVLNGGTDTSFMDGRSFQAGVITRPWTVVDGGQVSRALRSTPNWAGQGRA